MPRDWNVICESGSQSDQQNNDLQNNQDTAEKSQVIKEQLKVQEQKSENRQNQVKKHEQPHRQRPKFISDEQLIGKLKNKQIEERRKIKLVNLKSQQLLEEIKNHKLISYFKQIKFGDKPSFYIVSFKTQEDLIGFIQEKIQNRYRFFLHPYIKSEKQIQRQKQRESTRKRKFENEPKQRDQYNNRTNDRQGDGARRGRNRPQYQEEQQEKKKSLKIQRKNQLPTRQIQPETKPRSKNIVRARQQNQAKARQQNPQQSKISTLYVKVQPVKVKEHQRQKREEKLKEEQNEKAPVQFNYIIEKNLITIKQNKYSKNRIVDDIIFKKITDKWDRIKIYVKKQGLDKALDLAELIYEKTNYGLKKLPEQDTREEYIQIVLQTKCHVVHLHSQYKLLSGNEKKYFQEINSKNKYRISKEFSVDEYVRGFQAHQKQICKKWQQLFIRAQSQNIPNLLKLSWRLKRQFYLNININVGARDEIPFSILEIQPQTDKEKRPRVDASFVNSYLTN